MQYMPAIVWCAWVFLVGLMVGSFLNVVVARLPYQKSVVWPGSRCFTCLRPLRATDNLPILGYLRLRGRCRFCGATFSSRYLWVEVGTGVAFLALFVLEVLAHAGWGGPDWLRPWHHVPGMSYPFFSALPPANAWVLFLYHAFLLSLLIAAALVDLDHRIIPAQITYLGTFVGLIGSVLLPWPWPSLTVPPVPPGLSWALAPVPPTGATLWPAIGPPPDWAPAGSWQLGLLNGLVGAAAGMFVGRMIKVLFETGMGKEALGLGDADLLMMAGAFLGWQVAVLALPVGAVLTLPVILPPKIWAKIRGRESSAELPFGPGIAAGVVAVWWGWPVVGEFARPMFDLVLVGIIGVVCGGVMLVAGLLLRRG